MNSKYVCIALRMLKFEGVNYLTSKMLAVCGCNLTFMHCRPKYTAMAMIALPGLIVVCWMNGTIGTERTVRTFALLCVRLNLKVLLVCDAIVCSNVKALTTWLQRCSQYAVVISPLCIVAPNTLQRRWLLCLGWSSFVEWTERLVLNEQFVRLHCCVCDWTRRCYWCSIQYEVVSLPSCAILLSKYIYNHNDHSALIFAECVAGTVIVVLARNEQRVRLYCCACAWTWMYYWCGTRS